MAWPENVRKSDLRIEFYRGSGAGGQHRNKTSSACRITHLPTGVTSKCEEGRHQQENKTKAFRKLAVLLIPLMRSALRQASSNSNSNEKPLNSRVRSYHQQRNEVLDVRIAKTFRYTDILDGDLDELLDEIRREGRDEC